MEPLRALLPAELTELVCQYMSSLQDVVSLGQTNKHYFQQILKDLANPTNTRGYELLCHFAYVRAHYTFPSFTIESFLLANKLIQHGRCVQARESQFYKIAELLRAENIEENRYYRAYEIASLMAKLQQLKTELTLEVSYRHFGQQLEHENQRKFP